MDVISFDSRFFYNTEEQLFTSDASLIFPSRDFPVEFELDPSPNNPSTTLTMKKIGQLIYEGDIAYVEYASDAGKIVIRIFND